MQIALNKRIVAARDAESILTIVAAEHGVFNAVNAATACNRLAKTRGWMIESAPRWFNHGPCPTVGRSSDPESDTLARAPH